MTKETPTNEDYRKSFWLEQERITQEYLANSGFFNRAKAITRSSRNLTEYGKKENIARSLTRVLGGLVLIAAETGILRDMEHGGTIKGVLQNPGAMYLLCEGVAMFASGRLYPVGITIMDYATRGASGLANYVKKQKHQAINNKKTKQK